MAVNPRAGGGQIGLTDRGTAYHHGVRLLVGRATANVLDQSGGCEC